LNDGQTARRHKDKANGYKHENIQVLTVSSLPTGAVFVNGPGSDVRNVLKSHSRSLTST